MTPHGGRAALTIAGSDSGGGAGIQADVRTFARYGLLGCTVITAVTAQNTTGVTRVAASSPELVRAQLDAVLSDLPVRAIKTGMLATAAVVEATIEGLRAAGQGLPLVVDPVYISSSGTQLLDDAALALLREELLPMATLVTPNLPEAAALLGLEVAPPPAEAAEALVERLGGRCAVLITGGHSATTTRCTDLLQLPDGRRFFFEGPRVETTATHGTGCVLTAAITANLALGRPLGDAVRDAKSAVTAALRAAAPMGRGQGPIDTSWSSGTAEQAR